MTDITGLKSGAVLQRNKKNMCDITLWADFIGTPRISIGKLSQNTDGSWNLTDIFVGGPYNIEIQDDACKKTFSDVYVGDLWLLAGQSNMQGVGHMTPKDRMYAAQPSPELRALYLDDNWKPATPALHIQGTSVDASHIVTFENYLKSLKERNVKPNDLYPQEPKRAVGPGLYFAKEMYDLTGVPQGLLPTAVGGAPIGMWLPSGEDNYYSAACRRIRETGNNIKGVFWAQGEGEPDADGYPAKIESIRNDLCRRLNVSVIPWVQMQSFKCVISLDENESVVWSKFREMQRNMPKNTESLITIATNDAELDDSIHMSSDSQKINGIRGARAMHYLVTGKGHPEPDLKRVYVNRFSIVPECSSEIHLVYDNVVGNLRASGVPSGFSLRKKDESRPTVKHLCRISLEQNEVVLRFEVPFEGLSDYEIWYGYGNDFYCNITDEGNRAIPSMGPVYINADCE